MNSLTNLFSPGAQQSTEAASSWLDTPNVRLVIRCVLVAVAAFLALYIVPG